MKVRQKSSWTKDNQGKYARHVGWKLTRSGKRQQHKFRLGSTLKEAERREVRILHLWDTIERLLDTDYTFSGPLWTDVTLGWAKQIAGGAYPPRIERVEGEPPREYAGRVLTLRYQYAGFPLEPGDRHAFEIGHQSLLDAPPKDRFILLTPNPEHRPTRPADCPAIVPPPADARPQLGVTIGELALQPDPAAATEVSSRDLGATRLHETLRAYQDYIRDAYREADPESTGSDLTSWGVTQVKQVDSLISHHDDVPLFELNLDAIERMLNYWRGRPLKKGSDKPVAAVTAKKMQSALKKFLRWLHRTDAFDWQKPPEIEEIRGRVATLESDRKAGFEQVETFERDELVALNAVATPLERIILLLGLNCGFNAMEMATLRWEEVHLFTAHEDRLQPFLGAGTTDADSFIKRLRQKNTVYGEWLLFPQTVQGLEWLARKKQTRDQKYVLLKQNGETYFKRTKGGNRSSQLPSRFLANVDRAIELGRSVRRLSIGKLRKTSGNLVRQFGDSEQYSIFHTHKQSVRGDTLADFYSNRVFGKLIATQREIYEYLRPVFEAAGADPFPTD